MVANLVWFNRSSLVRIALALEPLPHAVERLRPEALHLRRRLRVRELRVLNRDLRLRGTPGVEVHLEAALPVAPGDAQRLGARGLADRELGLGQPAGARARVAPGVEQLGRRHPDGAAHADRVAV